ncbi:MAG TPA: PilZ domain-containing protein [Planctomycetota bacterium]|nr:PilZ domain-containing protein [Planctomycetota bacterium]
MQTNYSIMNAALERRKDRRLDLDLHVEFVEETNRGAALPLNGRTRNVSAGGLFLETSNALPEGALLVLDVAIPKRCGAAAEALALHCEGQVLRVMKLSTDANVEERFGVAVRFMNRPNIESQFLTHLLWEQD